MFHCNGTQKRQPKPYDKTYDMAFIEQKYLMNWEIADWNERFLLVLFL